MTQPRYTPKERAIRKRELGAVLVEWRKTHGMSTAERDKKRHEMRQRWAAMSDEEKAAWSEMCRQNTKRQMAERGHEYAVSLGRESWKKTGPGPRYQMTEEQRRKLGEIARSEKTRAWLKDKAKLDAMLLKIHTPEVQARSAEMNREEVKTNPRRGQFETNVNAEEWSLRDPRGVEHHFRNLRHFIRHHRSLFTPRQLEVRTKTGRTRIEACLASLSPRHTFLVTCSQGWTWVFTPGEDDPRLCTANTAGQPPAAQEKPHE